MMFSQVQQSNSLGLSLRDVLELKEAVKIKDGESEAYISEIETISQAYEDMQTQNQHLLQQVAERDDYNIKAKQFSKRLIYLVATEHLPKQVEESKMDMPKEIFLKDYKVPDYYFCMELLF
ncbi:E3 ubiquitin-protein ligase BRE1-like 2 isoform X1 [Camellia sinensis]|uniref:E3 ubiquitin-protein ligase BRE1-like 2 isoform X1 n=1 Tax=Camellia sinensis TaxID=4442 RepID=UPI0010368B12|nr:E3 ubiquitin-protein ligase BRE1-like 2 isoform X1 [Camellia sinensis]